MERVLRHPQVRIYSFVVVVVSGRIAESLTEQENSRQPFYC